MSDHEDDTTPLEYFVTGLVVLFFGLLYWFLNHSAGFGAASLDDSALTATGSETSIMEDDFAAKLPETAPVEAKKPVPESEAENKKLALKQSENDRLQKELVRKQAETERLLAEDAARKKAEAERLLAEEAAVKQAEQLKAKEALKKQAELEALKAKEASLKLAESKRLKFMLPDGNEVMVSDEGFEGVVKNAMVKNTLNDPMIFDAIAFESGSASLNASSQDQIRVVAALMNTYKNIKVLIRGHTDNIGNVNDNSLLSLTRSDSMKNELVSLGIDAGRVKIEGVGPMEPVASNDTEEGRKLNRRIELVLIE